jgi:hypothetical protein
MQVEQYRQFATTNQELSFATPGASSSETSFRNQKKQISHTMKARTLYRVSRSFGESRSSKEKASWLAGGKAVMS